MSNGFLLGFGLALVSALFWASYDVVRKFLGGSMSATAGVAGLMGLHIPLLGPVIGAREVGWIGTPETAIGEVLFVGVPELSGTYFALAAVVVVLNLAANFLFLRAVQISPLGLTTPYLAFTPVFSVVPAYVWYSEQPTSWGIVGIATVCLGAFLLNPGSDEDGWLSPLRALTRERGSLYMLAVAVIWSITPTLNKAASEATSPMWHTFVLATGVGLAFIAARAVADGGVDDLVGEWLESPGWLVVGAALAIGALVVQFVAYRFIEVAYIETVKRAVGVVGAVAAGYLLFDEGDLAQRLAAAATMAVGVSMILLGG